MTDFVPDTPSSKLRNEDFRKLLSSARSERAPSSSLSSGLEHSNRLAPDTHFVKPRQVAGGNAANKQKKKHFYRPPPKEKVEKTEIDEMEDELQEKLKDISSRYRDRAAERRKGENKEDFDEADVRMKIAGGFKAVPRTQAAAMSAAERRKLAIEESKYLGGDMEHTHLVKGLDYSLLNKVRSEIVNKKEEEEQDELEAQIAETKVIPAPEKVSQDRMVRNIVKILFHSQPPQKNEYFGRGRMAYVAELEDEEAEVPTTLIRSVHDMPDDKSSANINTDNMLIQKLTQVLSYLRADTKKKKTKKEEDELDLPADRSTKEAVSSIYDDIGEYVPSKNRDKDRERNKDDRRDKDRSRDDRDRRDRDVRDKPSSYFDDRRSEKERDRDRDRERDRDRRDRDREERRRREEEESRKREAPSTPKEPKVDPEKKRRRLDEEDAYSELYPMGMGMIEAGGDSDEETDFSKMDLGNRSKGLVKRWDFDTAEEYERYQSGREALPKAAFQYGIKSGGGRKTRKTEGNKKNEEKKIDRELQKIEKLWDKKKTAGESFNVKY